MYDSLRSSQSYLRYALLSHVPECSEAFQFLPVLIWTGWRKHKEHQACFVTDLASRIIQYIGVKLNCMHYFETLGHIAFFWIFPFPALHYRCGKWMVRYDRYGSLSWLRWVSNTRPSNEWLPCLAYLCTISYWCAEPLSWQLPKLICKVLT